MKKILSFFIFSVLAYSSYSQLTIQSGATFFIQPGATVTVQGDVVTNTDIQGTGTLLFKGSALQTLFANGFTIPNIQLDNTNNVALGSAVIVGNSLVFTNGKFLLNTANLTLAPTATVSGFDNTKYVITNNTGRLVKNNLGATPFTFPVGFDATTYNPLTLTQNGTAENIGVKVNQKVLAGGTSGLPFVKEVVDASWDLSESVVGANNINMTAGWNGTDELTGFNRAKTGISFFDGVGWDMTNAVTGAASGGGPYTINRNAVTNLGVFAVGTRPVLISLLSAPRIYLQGPAFSAGLMSDGLRTSGQIPLLDPYTGLSNFTHSGSGGGESIPSSVLATTGTGADIVDWGFAELRNGGTGAIITTRAVLIQRDGNLVDVDGTDTKTPYINFAGELAGNYFVAVRHRNSLGVRSAGNISLARTTATAYNFTTSLSQAFSGAVSNDAMATITSGVFGLWGGNANSDLNTRRTGSATVNDYSLLLNYLGTSLIIPGVYRREDFNMDGTVRRTGSATVNDYSKLLNILGTALIITQPSF